MKEQLPVATILLIVANIGVAALTLGTEQAAYSYGFIPDAGSLQSAQQRLISLLAGIFVHVEPFHLFTNMVLLAALGPVVERAAGWWRTLTVYFLGALVGVLAHWAIVSVALPAAAQKPLVGASGGIAGLVGYSLVRFFRGKVQLFPKVGVPVYVVVLAWVGLEILGAVLSVRAFDLASSHWAHLGGVLTGVILSLLFGSARAVESEAWEERLADAQRKGADAVAAVARARFAKNPEDSKALESLAKALIESGRLEEAKQMLLRLVRDAPLSGGGVGVSLLLDNGWIGELPARVRLRAAAALMKVVPTLAERTLLTVLEDPPSEDTPDALFMLVELSAESDQDGARRYATMLTSQFGLSPQAERLRIRYPGLSDR
jgi:membrane associated rhomboid family serine protease